MMPTLKTWQAGALLLAASSSITLARAVQENPAAKLPGALLRGQVVDASGRPVQGARVCASSSFPQGHSVEPACVASGPDGAATLPSAPYGMVRVSVTAEGYAPIDGEPTALNATSGHRTWVLNPAGAVAGSLVDANGRGVGRARVSLLDRLRGKTVEGSTDAGGIFRIDGLAPGFWRVEIEPAEHLSLVRDSILVNAHVTTDLGSLRARPGPILDGRIVGADGSLAAGAEIRILEAAGARRTLRSATSGENGLFHVGGLPGDAAVDLLVRPRQGSPRAFRGLTLPVTDGMFAVEGAVSLRGSVSVDGRAIPAGTQVAVSLRSSHPAFEANSGHARTAPVDPATGAFTVENVPVGGEVEARVFAPGLPAASATVWVAPGQDVGPLDLEIRRREPVVRGEVRDRDGRPVAGARIGTTATDGEGRFVLETLEPGQTKTVVTHPSFAPLSHELTPGTEEETVLVLERGGSVEGTVTDTRGRPVVGVRVSAEWPGASTTTGVGGRYRIDHIPSGEASVQRQGAGASGDFERRKITIQEGETKTLHFKIGAGILEGSITRAGLPVSGAILSVTLSSDGKRTPRPQEYLYQTTSTDEDGGFRLGGLVPGPATMVVNFGKQNLTFPIDIPQAPGSRLDLEMPEYVLRGVVLDGTGKPLENACVGSEVSPASGAAAMVAQAGEEGDGSTRSTTRTRTDAEGRFLLFTEKEAPSAVTVCTCGNGCQEVAVEPVPPDEPVTLWFAPTAQQIGGEDQD